MDSRTIVLSCGTALSMFVLVNLYQKVTLPTGSYEILPMHSPKANKQEMINKTKNLIDAEWPSTNIKFDTKKVLPTHLILIRNNTEVIGHVSMVGRLGDPSADPNSKSKWKAKTDPVLYIASLVVDPKYRGYGWGKTLMASIYDYCDKNKLFDKGVKRFEGHTGSRQLAQFYSNLNGKLTKQTEKIDQSGWDVKYKYMYGDVKDPEMKVKCKDILDKQCDKFDLKLEY